MIELIFSILFKQPKVPLLIEERIKPLTDIQFVEDTKAMDPMSGTSPQVRQMKLLGLSQSQKYSVRVNTVVNGKIIAHRSEMIEAVLKQEDENIQSNLES